MYPGPPNTPSTLTFPDKHVDMQSEQFLAVWSVPFSHSNHSISSYNVSVGNINTTKTCQRSITVSPGAKSPATENDTLDFPPSTSSCDILIVTLTAINDIGSSEPVSASLFIPTGITLYNDYLAIIYCKIQIQIWQLQSQQLYSFILTEHLLLH